MAQKANLKFRLQFLKLLKSKKIHFFLRVILVLVIFLNFSVVILQHKERYINFNYSKYFPTLEKMFLSSQYVSKHPSYWIPDELAFSYSGEKLIKGTSPVLVVPDAPPLGKYIIGLSINLFNNDAISVLLAGILSLVLLYFVSLQIFSNKTLALIPPFLLSFETIFKNQFIYVPLLDIFQLLFLLASIYFFNKGLTGKKVLLFFSLASLFLGFFISTKFFISGLTIIGAWYLVLLLKGNYKKLVLLTSTLPISVAILLLSYIRVFAFGYTFSKFLGIQKWVFLYHKSFLILPLSIWPLLLMNRWYVWFGNKPVISDSQWMITWPIITVLSIITILLYLFKKIPRNINIEVLMAWFVIYMVFLSFGEAFSRYFVILIPVLYIIALYGVVEFVKLKTNVKKN